MYPTYFKRYRMEISLEGTPLPALNPPPGYRLLRWDARLLEWHAQAKYRSFRDELDAHVFPCLGEAAGCLRLMQEIAEKQGFLPGATWLAIHEGSEHVADYHVADYCGTVQGVHDPSGMGGIQNLGITPEHRGRGLGTCLLYQALRGFREAGLRRAFLEVTAKNSRAVRLYRRVGFRHAKTVYKSVEAAVT
jgi:ribosomal protein S18 acetylase RimI-like enzyme